MNLHGVRRPVACRGGKWPNPRDYAISRNAAVGSLRLRGGRFGTESVRVGLGGVSLIATLVSLIVTDLISDGFSISGFGTWLAATVIVWVVSLLAVFILPYLGLKKYLEEQRA